MEEGVSEVDWNVESECSAMQCGGDKEERK